MPMLRLMLLFLFTLIPATGYCSGNSLKIIAVGDSLIAGYGLNIEDNFTTQLQAELALSGIKAEIINAGISGDTTAGGYSRIDSVISQKPDIVILCLGANDALRGLEPETAKDNLDKILAKLKKSKTRILLAGMKAPLNFGIDYANRFNAIYAPLAKKYDTDFYPFFLEGVAMQPELNQPDGLHPNAAGIKKIVAGIIKYIR